MNIRFVITTLLITLTCFLSARARLAIAQKPSKLNASQIKSLTRDGDRFADQGDYLSALKKYTEAYLGVVSKIRGQDFQEPVEPKMFNREELGQEMLEQMAKEYSDQDLLLMDSSYKALGLMAPDLQSKEIVTKLLTEEVAGFYDPDNKRMVLIVEDGPKEDPGWLGRLFGAKPTFDKDEQKTTLAHELTHALQDQLYDLNAMEEGIEDDDDMLLAFAALVEGDATLLMFAEADASQDITQMDPDAMRTTFNLMSWMLPLAGGNTYRQAPPIFRDSLTFPYFQGMIFVLSLAGENGWDAVHSAYQHPPLSTEQILHPEKYRDNEKLDVPQHVKIPNCQDLLGERWQLLGGNCLGELQTRIMLKKVSGGSRAARGWDGDRYEIFRDEDGKLAMLFVSIWDTDNDAKEFHTAYEALREINPFETQSVFAQNSDRSVTQNGKVVYAIEGFDKTLATQLLPRLQDTTFEDKIFPQPKQHSASKSDQDVQTSQSP